MKVYTQAEFDAIDRDEYGIKHCPTGDYSQIKDFGKGCSFGERCSFGAGCSFGERCSFGKECRFGAWCRFGEECRFGERCSFGEGCNFGAGCNFGEECRFGEGCSFGEGCNFGERCRFENVGEYVGRYPYVAFIGCGSRFGSKTYVYNLDRGIYVRCGCFLGTLAEFRERVRTKDADPLYLDFADLAERRLNEWRVER